MVTSNPARNDKKPIALDRERTLLENKHDDVLNFYPSKIENLRLLCAFVKHWRALKDEPQKSVAPNHRSRPTPQQKSLSTLEAWRGPRRKLSIRNARREADLNSFSEEPVVYPIGRPDIRLLEPVMTKLDVEKRDQHMARWLAGIDKAKSREEQLRLRGQTITALLKMAEWGITTGVNTEEWRSDKKSDPIILFTRSAKSVQDSERMLLWLDLMPATRLLSSSVPTHMALSKGALKKYETDVKSGRVDIVLERKRHHLDNVKKYGERTLHSRQELRRFMDPTEEYKLDIRERLELIQSWIVDLLCAHDRYESAITEKAVDEFEGRLGVGVMLRTGEARYAEPEDYQDGIRWIFHNTAAWTQTFVYHFEARWLRAEHKAHDAGCPSVKHHSMLEIAKLLLECNQKLPMELLKWLADREDQLQERSVAQQESRRLTT